MTALEKQKRLVIVGAQNYETDYLSFGLKSRLSLRHTRQIVQAIRFMAYTVCLATRDIFETR